MLSNDPSAGFIVRRSTAAHTRTGLASADSANVVTKQDEIIDECVRMVLDLHHSQSPPVISFNSRNGRHQAHSMRTTVLNVASPVDVAVTIISDYDWFFHRYVKLVFPNGAAWIRPVRHRSHRRRVAGTEYPASALACLKAPRRPAPPA